MRAIVVALAVLAGAVNAETVMLEARAEAVTAREMAQRCADRGAECRGFIHAIVGWY